MKIFQVLVAFLVLLPVVRAEDVFRESFEGPPRDGPLKQTWGDKPVEVAGNATAPDVGYEKSAAARLSLTFPAEVKHNLSYWSYTLPERVPLSPQLESISFRVKTNVPVSIKIAISPYGFIYHGPGVGPLCTRWT